MSAWLDRLRALDSETDPSPEISVISAAAPVASVSEIMEILAPGSVEKRGPAPAVTFLCPGCRRLLPIARRADRDFTTCACCKLDAIEARHRRRRWGA
jgi:hypothetical protein